MRENVVMITDKKDRKFLMTIRTPSAWEKLQIIQGMGGGEENLYRASWETIDKGFLRYQGGDAWREGGLPEKDPSSSLGLNKRGATDLRLRLPGGNDVARDNLPLGSRLRSWGLILYRYDSVWDTNDSGTGEVVQAWVLGMEPGQFKWKLATTADLMAVQRQNSPPNR